MNAVNALLTLHALVLHSACHREYSELSECAIACILISPVSPFSMQSPSYLAHISLGSFLGWLMISPRGHNMHHLYGERWASATCPCQAFLSMPRLLTATCPLHLLRHACNFAPIFNIWECAITCI